MEAITIQNYPELIKKIGISSLNEGQKEAHDLIVEASDNFKDFDQWDDIMDEPKIAEVVTMYFDQLKAMMASSPIKLSPPKQKPKSFKMPAIVNALMPLHQQKIVYESEELQMVALDVEKMLNKIPTERNPNVKNASKQIAYAHYFYGQSDWWITEYIPEDGLFFGYVILNGDLENSEWGYISVDELRNSKSIELDFYWTPNEIGKILYKEDSNFFENPDSDIKAVEYVVDYKKAKAEKRQLFVPKSKGNKKIPKQVARSKFKKAKAKSRGNKKVPKQVARSKYKKTAKSRGRKPVNKPVTKVAAKPRNKVVKKPIIRRKKAITKKVVHKPLKDKVIAKPVQSRKVFSREIQIIKRFVNMDGKIKTLRSVELLNKLCAGLIQRNDVKDHKSLINHITDSTGTFITQLKSANGTQAKVSMNADTKAKMNKAIAEVKERLRVSYLSGVENKTKRAGGSGVKKSKSVASSAKKMRTNKTVPLKQSAPVKRRVSSAECRLQSKQSAASKRNPVKSLAGFIRADQEPESRVGTFRLPGDIGTFMGDLQRYKLAITLSGSRGAGKTWLSTDIINAFIEAGFDVGFFSLEQGGMESKDTKAAIEHNVSAHNRQNLAVTGEAKNGLATIKEYAEQFDLIVIDSWQKLGLPNTEFDRLRQEHPNTMWLVIFQQNANGGQRNGVAAEFDAPIVLRAETVDRTGKNNFVVADKNRGNKIDMKYMIHAKKVVQLYDDGIANGDDDEGEQTSDVSNVFYQQILAYFKHGQRYLRKVHIRMIEHKYNEVLTVTEINDQEMRFENGRYMPDQIQDVVKRGQKLIVTSKNGTVVEEFSPV